MHFLTKTLGSHLKLPDLGAGECLVPNSFYLTGVFKSNNTKSWFLNNLGKLLVKSLQITIKTTIVYDNVDESHFAVYKDLWMTEKQRSVLKNEGILSENIRKLMSKDDSANKSSTSDNTMVEVLNGRIKIKLGWILNIYGLYPPAGMDNAKICYIITLPKPEEIMVAQANQSIINYLLDDLKLEYTTIQNQSLYNDVLNSFSPRTLMFNHITMEELTTWEKGATTNFTYTVNAPYESIKYIVLLFKKQSAVTDSEEFVCPPIKKVKVSYEGNPNAVYSGGLERSEFFAEAQKVFLNDELGTVTMENYYSNKFALVVDLRTFPDNNVVGTGIRILNTQKGITLTIERDSATENLNCYIYFVGDARVGIDNYSFSEFIK